MCVPVSMCLGAQNKEEWRGKGGRISGNQSQQLMEGTGCVCVCVYLRVGTHTLVKSVQKEPPG